MVKKNKIEQLKKSYAAKKDIYNNLKFNVGKKLFEIREKQGYTQQEIADIIGITRASLSNYEKGKRTIDIETLYRLCSLYDVSIDYLVGTKSTPTTEIDYQETETYKSLGFSEKTLDVLWSDSSFIELINDLIKHKDFNTLQELNHCSRYTRYESMDTEYRSFLTSKLLYEMISDIYEQWYIDNDERIKTLSSEEKQHLLHTINQYLEAVKTHSEKYSMCDYNHFEEMERQVDLLARKLKKYM